MLHSFITALERAVLSLKLPDYVGLFGSAIVVAQYFLSITGRMDVQGLVYPVLNIIGCFLIGFSLIFHFNTASFLIEIFWATVSAYGIVRFISRRGLSKA